MQTDGIFAIVLTGGTITAGDEIERKSHDIKTEDAVGHVLCHDMTQIIGREQGPALQGRIVTQRTFGYCFRKWVKTALRLNCSRFSCTRMTRPERLCALCQNANMRKSDTKGQIRLSADIDGVFLVDTERLNAVNSIDEIMIATRRGQQHRSSGE